MSQDRSQFNLFDYFLGQDRLDQIGDRVAIAFRDRRISYQELFSQANWWADRILRCGVREGNCVALLLYDSPEFIACVLATVWIGAVCVPMNTSLTAADLSFILSDSGARLVIAESELEDKVKASDTYALLTIDRGNQSHLDRRASSYTSRLVSAHTTRETPAFLLYTSGSTGAPKGVLHV